MSPTATLPPALRAFMATREFVMLMVGSDRGTLLAVRIPNQDIESCRGRVGFLLRHELFQTDSGPVLRLVIKIKDQPDSHLTLEMFTNPADAAQMAEFADLCERDHLRMLFFDDTLTCRLAKTVSQAHDEERNSLAIQARRKLAEIDPSRLDFIKAKTVVMTENPLD